MVVGVGSSLFMRVWGMGCMGKMKVVEALVLIWVGSRGVCRIREIWGEGKERKRVFLLFIGRFVDVWERWRDGFSIGIVFDMGKRGKGKRIKQNLQKDKRTSVRTKMLWNPVKSMVPELCFAL